MNGWASGGEKEEGMAVAGEREGCCKRLAASGSVMWLIVVEPRPGKPDIGTASGSAVWLII